MKDAARYLKIVEWSEEDQCFVGSAPGLVFGGFHGDDEMVRYLPSFAGLSTSRFSCTGERAMKDRCRGTDMRS